MHQPGVLSMAEWYVPWTLAMILFIFEIATHTFYLAALGVAMLILGLIDLWIPLTGIHAIVVFAVLCVLLLPVAEYARRALRNRASTEASDLDSGQKVVVTRVNGRDLEVRYRDTVWKAELTEAAVIVPGATLRIISRTGNLLHVAPPS
ncbi:conserved hypothetical protein, membrane, partial [mine drainage metagenome]